MIKYYTQHEIKAACDALKIDAKVLLEYMDERNKTVPSNGVRYNSIKVVKR